MNRFGGLKRVVTLWLLVFGMFLGAVAGAATPVPTGLWHGNLQTPAGVFTLELNVKQDEHGALVAIFESLDQAPGVATPVSRVHVENDVLTLEINAISAVYEGHFDAASGSWIGTWRQGVSLPLAWVRGPVPPQAAIDGIDGTWRGTLARNGQNMRLILHVSTSNRGTRAKLDSPDMGVAGLEIADLSRAGNHLHWRVPAGSVVFDGDLDDKTGNLVGTWRREGMPAATVKFVRDMIEKAPAQATQERPQTPRPPFPYSALSIRFSNANDGISLAGTLTIPPGAGPFPAAVLISGSGPEDRDATMFDHKPFAVLADYLTRRGIAVLRYDDRGVGESAGDFNRASIPDFVSDARAAVAFLAARPEINAGKIGLIGHSQGGIVGPIAALHNSSVAFVVLLAAPATSMADVMLAQRRMLGTMQGRSEVALDTEESAWAGLYAELGRAVDRKTAQNSVNALLTLDVMRKLGIRAAQKPAMIEQLTSDTLRDLLHYDASATLGALNIPLLALNGDLDHQVPAPANLAVIRRVTARNTDVTVLQLAGLNHFFQPAKNGAIAEYDLIETTFAPEALQLIGEWIAVRVGRENKRV